MSSSRKLPASYNVSTYGDSSRDYTSLDIWEAATDNDLVTAAKGEVLKCYDDSSTFNDGTVLDGATTNADYYRVIMPADDEGHDGTPNNGVNFTGTWDGWAIFAIDEDYSRIHDITVTNTNTGNYAVGLQTIHANNYLVGCIVHDITTASVYNVGIWVDKGNCVNCLATNIANGSVAIGYVVNDLGGNNFYNCNCVDTDAYGFYVADGRSGTAKNCISENNTTNWFEDGSGTWTKTTCTDDDGVVFKDSANDDYHLAANDTAARNQGTDLSSDATFAFDDDIDGDTRSGTWDIGFDEVTRDRRIGRGKYNYHPKWF